MATKKVKSAGRYGIRYGKKIRDKTAAVESNSRAVHKCPSCLKKGLKRQAAGIWQCRICNLKLAGGAYSPKTSATKIIENALAKKQD
ncbi:MAG: 50S ribosomal protein L37ae [Candidatus Aenigmarchaeota archaeon]|nr:50S ribosomal protein L37ae [Candidatus Aenigmarchaeota archaeon]NOQ37494.1 50S ribosomal protein L37ae [archaeon]MCK4927196.1 50S ribosomal protein L37ae [Candidatus Aenigmarchaeota archaeon]MCK5042818.1 50S ribosomal protein L37ae [Candidatus Aenigmarchaeota archaeon]MCK5063354.1 50S ribosomal protein L37ae [Candidatus Aenigmarchaeota archaeon]